ncbi:MAG: MGMT family protein [Solirubrobacteraceae bacterium]|nr:MGMT family protein [Solirubrobacteraceae bacterium]
MRRVAQTPVERDARILAIIRAIPEGFVRTYGDIAPRTPRLVGKVLRDCDDLTVPWWRVVRADGSVTQGERQLALLREELVPLRGSKVDLADARFPLPPGELD